jgi:hypothetical protein
MRTKRLLCIAVIVTMSAFLLCSTVAQTAPPAAAPVGSPTAPVGSPAAPVGSPAVELVKTLAWPIVVLLIAVGFRKSIGLFLSALGSRITKLSVFKVELELVPATAATTYPLLDDIRTATNSAMISDSSRTMLEQVQSSNPADFAVVALGDGKEWLTSRLYIAAVMLERMRGVKVFVFVESAPNTERRLVAVASVRQLRWALARRYPWLEAALVRAQLSLFPPIIPPDAAALPAGAEWLADPRTLSMPQPAIMSDTGALDPFWARQTVSKFIDLLQDQPPPSSDEWVTLGNKTIQERADWVTRELLLSLLQQEAFTAWMPALRDAPRAQRTRAVLRRPAEFVALVDDDREFVRLANRLALLEEIAASLGEEPDRS